VYRPAYSETEALEIMAREKGTIFDPRLFECMQDIFPELKRIQQEINESLMR